MKPVPHGEPYAGKLHVRFDEGAGVPHGASRSTLHPFALTLSHYAKRVIHNGAEHAGNFLKRDSLREGGELTFEMSD